MTDPSRDILDRDISVAATREAAVAASNLLVEVVNYGSAVLSRCKHHLGPLPLKAEDRALLVLLRQVLEATDTLQILADRGTMAGADPLLRAELEAFLSISFITVGDADSRRKRGRAYMLLVLRHQLRLLRERQPGTNENRSLLKSMKGDKYASEFEPHPEGQDTQQIAGIERALSDADMLAVASDYDELTKSGKERWVKWYRLYEGPRNLLDLAKRVNQGAVYEMLYRTWSASAHAQDVALPTDSEWLRLRSHQSFRTGVSFALWIALEALRAVLMVYRPFEWDDMTSWYNREVKPRRDQFRGLSLPDIALGG